MTIALIIALCAALSLIVALTIGAIFANGRGTCACGCDDAAHEHGSNTNSYCAQCGPIYCPYYRPAYRGAS